VAAKPSHRSLAPWFNGLGFLVLAGAIFYVWQYPRSPAETAARTSADNAVEQRLSDMDTRLTRLEQRPTVDLGPITARIDALERKVADPTAELGQVTSRIATLEGRVVDPTPALGRITARLDAIEGRVGDQTQLASRLDTLSGRIEALSGRDQTSLDATTQQLGALTNRVAGIESNATNFDAVAKRLSRIARLQEAGFALESGRPVGDVPDAPAALARFAHTAPPTEEQLRLRFLRAKQAALAAKQPDDSDAPLANRVWERAQGLITIRRGDDVVIGNPSAVALDHAQSALDSGDLTGAVSAVEPLKGAPGQAMATWLADAKALLGAQAALAAMADQA
jgi:hypothetical protein